MNHPPPPPSLEAKLVILGSQSVGKTSLITRYTTNDFHPPHKCVPTIGASFITTSIHDAESGTTIRMQIWDTAGQERFRSLSRLYYRNATAAILAYDVGSRRSFEEMKGWLRELREQRGEEIVVHVVGTKVDVVAQEPGRREVPFEECVEYVAEQLLPEVGTAAAAAPGRSPVGSKGGSLSRLSSVGSMVSTSTDLTKTPSLEWTQDTVFDFCHEVSAKDGEGIDEVFRVIARKLVERQNRKDDIRSAMRATGRDSKIVVNESPQSYFDLPRRRQSSFRLSIGENRLSWLGRMVTPAKGASSGGQTVDVDVSKGVKQRGCC